MHPLDGTDGVFSDDRVTAPWFTLEVMDSVCVCVCVCVYLSSHQQCRPSGNTEGFVSALLQSPAAAGRVGICSVP